MTSMKLDPADEESQDETQGALYPDKDKPEYPYGLCFCLEEEQIKKLGMAKMPTAGEELTLTVKVKVTRVGEVDTQDEGTERSLSFQITDMAIGG